MRKLARGSSVLDGFDYSDTFSVVSVSTKIMKVVSVGNHIFCLA